MTQEEWWQKNKHVLRDLYAQFLSDMGYTDEQITKGKCPSYVEFQDYMFKQSKHYKDEQAD